ncbi:hypothetical protein SLA2020_300950 [Shorea laevis]
MSSPMNGPVFLPGSSPEDRARIGNASPETARHVALRMYESMKRHGLGEEAGKVFNDEIEEVKGVGEGEGDGVGKKSKELLGMEYLLKEGFVNYLHDMAKITPPILRQVVRFSGIEYWREFERSEKDSETFGNKVVDFILGPFKALF